MGGACGDERWGPWRRSGCADTAPRSRACPCHGARAVQQPGSHLASAGSTGPRASHPRSRKLAPRRRAAASFLPMGRAHVCERRRRWRRRGCADTASGSRGMPLPWGAGRTAARSASRQCGGHSSSGITPRSRKLARGTTRRLRPCRWAALVVVQDTAHGIEEAAQKQHAGRPHAPTVRPARDRCIIRASSTCATCALGRRPSAAATGRGR
jgi:hypothetical protein